MEVEEEEVKQEAKSSSDGQTTLVLRGVTFSPARSNRTSKVFQFYWVSESTENVVCLKCHKILKGINTKNCASHLDIHDSPLNPEIQSFLRSLKGKQGEKEEAEHKALEV